MLSEREMILDVQTKEIQHRGETQKMLEIEVDRLYRLKELKSYCMRVSSIRSLREKEQEKKISEAATANFQESMNAAAASDEEESVGENFMQSPSSTSSEIVATEKEK
ncbi:high mobility group B protein 6-like [Melia azedarach]|uniref:High mobility group B protein 6-like n=1 Tax=Melia azedarach TaxID=155640 RepID=A0ACC1WZN1_MELAZ|nr:high mobility group B protein 6-like [Melia azedarach]